MAEHEIGAEEKTEDPTEERREEFAKRGDIAQSKDLSSLLAICVSVGVLCFYGTQLYHYGSQLFKRCFEGIGHTEVTPRVVLAYVRYGWLIMLMMILPVLCAHSLAASLSTFLQTRFRMSWEKIQFDLSRLDPFSGLGRMVSGHALMEISKGFLKIFFMGLIAYFVLRSEQNQLIRLVQRSPVHGMGYFLKTFYMLFWSISSVLLVLAVGDYFYTYMSFEKKMRMTKQEVKEEYKQREVDPVVRQRMRRMQRDFLSQKTIESTKKATVLITNPTHYAVALHYEMGMKTPKVVAKGIDFIALRMKEIAQESHVPIVENVPLARKLYAEVEVDEDIHETLYKAVSEVIRYVFRLKGIKLQKSIKKSKAILHEKTEV